MKSGHTYPLSGPARRPVHENSPGQTRTADLVVNSHPLYQLSYRGKSNRGTLLGSSDSLRAQCYNRVCFMSTAHVPQGSRGASPGEVRMNSKRIKVNVRAAPGGQLLRSLSDLGLGADFCPFYLLRRWQNTHLAHAKLRFCRLASGKNHQKSSGKAQTRQTPKKRRDPPESVSRRLTRAVRPPSFSARPPWG